MDFYEHFSVSLHLSGLEVLEECASANYKSIQLLQHQNLGRILVLDGEIQHIEVWAPLYHETIVHLPSSFIPKVKRVLILGGGCFFTAKEILKYDSIKEVTMIDFDEKVIQMIIRHYDHAKDVLKDERFNLVINDAFIEMRNLNSKYDLIINDSIDLMSRDPENPADIFLYLASLTSKEGVCVDMIYRHIFEKETTEKTISILKEKKLHTAYSLITVPEYPGILHLLVIWSNEGIVSQKLKRTRNLVQKKWVSKALTNPCEYFNPDCLNYYLYLPPYLRRISNGSNHF